VSLQGPHSAATKKSTFRKKLQSRYASHASDLSKALNGAAPLSREERKNEQIIKMIERQDKLRMRRENKKSGIQVGATLTDLT